MLGFYLSFCRVNIDVTWTTWVALTNMQALKHELEKPGCLKPHEHDSFEDQVQNLRVNKARTQ